jgi:hypothetical protein
MGIKGFGWYDMKNKNYPPSECVGVATGILIVAPSCRSRIAMFWHKPLLDFRTSVAEREEFEPSEPYGSTVFEALNCVLRDVKASLKRSGLGCIGLCRGNKKH